MNKQIRLIAALSGYQPERNFEHFDIEKFAQSIVKECAQVSLDNAGYNGLNISDKILKHFGVT